tara:strand:+ start:3239 stop:3568 length:330 start_codon:yes stop_codon:yes gene_type:complete
MLETLKNSLFADLGSFAIGKVKSITKPKKVLPAYMTEEISDEEMLQQSKENVRYINSQLSILRPMTQVRGNSAGETRKKRKNIREQIEWYEDKLKEEKGMVKHYTQKLQ